MHNERDARLLDVGTSPWVQQPGKWVGEWVGGGEPFKRKLKFT